MTTNHTLVTAAVLRGLPFTAMAMIAGSSIALAGQLPEGLPTGAADGRIPLGALTAATLVVGGVIGLGAPRLGRRVNDPTTQRVLVGLGVGGALAVAALHIGGLLAALDGVPIDDLPASALVAAALAMLTGANLGAAVTDPERRGGRALPVSALELAPGEAAVWSGRGSAAPWTRVALVTGAGAAAALFLNDLPWLGVGLAALTAVAWTCTRVAVTVGPRGCTARLGPFGLVRFHVPMDDIEGARAEQLDPLAEGGWGLRWLPTVRGVVLREGPGLRVTRRDGTDVVVTVDDPEAAVSVLMGNRSARPS